MLERWWGPRGFTTTTHAFNFRRGGTWKHTMHGPDGTDYPNRIVYSEIQRPERIVFSHHGGVDGAPALFQHTVTFVARGDHTELTMRQVWPTAAERDAVVTKYGAAEGAKETLARLAEDLQAISPAGSKPELRMTRVFDAPRHLVFEAWSKAEHVAQWFTPAPLTTPSCEVDLRTGGVFRVVMRMPNGVELPMNATFAEVVPNERIVFTATIHGGVDIHTTVTLEDSDAGKTTLRVHQTYSHESEATRGAPAGWTQTLDQLAEVLRKLL